MGGTKGMQIAWLLAPFIFWKSAVCFVTFFLPSHLMKTHNYGTEFCDTVLCTCAKREITGILTWCCTF